MPGIRCFIAIELSEEIRRELGRFQNALRSRVRLPVAWVDPRAIHLTLKFLGDTPTESIEAVQQGLVRATTGVEPLQIALGRFGAFPNLMRPRVLWVDVDGDTAGLSDLQQRVERHVAPLGFPTERRAFQPHLTLGRVRLDRSAGALNGGPIHVDGGVTRTQQNIDSLSLMKSQLTPRGAVYTQLATLRFRPLQT